MTIEGDYGLFAHLETVYLGCMARRTLVMRNVKAVVEAAHGKPILFFPARHDHWLVQTGDGWAAHVAGAIGVSTDAQASWWGGRGVGTVPHALIAAFGGDTVAAARLFADRYHGETNITVLVDFENDSVRHRARGRRRAGRPPVGRAPGHQRAARRRRAAGRAATPTATAASRALLARRVRDALDAAGHEHVRIVVSGGFDAEKIARFEAEGAPVDAYGVGSSLLRGQQRLHRRRRPRRRPAAGEGRPAGAPEPPPRARRLEAQDRRDAPVRGSARIEVDVDREHLGVAGVDAREPAHALASDVVRLHGATLPRGRALSTAVAGAVGCAAPHPPEGPREGIPHAFSGLLVTMHVPVQSVRQQEHDVRVLVVHQSPCWPRPSADCSTGSA